MKKVLFTFLSCALLVGGFAYANDHDHDHGDKKSPATSPSTKPVNHMCAVNPKDAVDDRVTVVYEGKVIGFCCEDCKADFAKDPKKYIAAMK